MSLIAGSADVHGVIDKLRARRPVVHSEADFQHAFAWALHQMQPALNIRLEVRQDLKDGDSQQGRRKHVDLYCFGPHGHTFLEFKYFTGRWDGVDPATGEQFGLRAHTATDLPRRGFVFDIARVERFSASKPAANGFAIMLTNDRRLWTPPSTNGATRDQQFRIHEGLTLTGIRRWGTEGKYFDANERKLSGNYPMRWHDYSTLEERPPPRCGGEGWPSVNYADPRRSAEIKRTQPSTQAGHWYSQALSKAIMLLDSHPDHESLMVLPDYPRYRDLTARTRTGRAAAGIHCLLLAADGGHICTTWTP